MEGGNRTTALAPLLPGGGPGIRTRGDLQNLINTSISPYYVKKEIIESGEENMDIGDKEDEYEQEEPHQEAPDVVNVVIPSIAPAVPAATTNAEEDGEETLRFLATLFAEPDPVAASPPTATIPKLDHRYFTVKGLRKKDTGTLELNSAAQHTMEAAPGFLVKDDDRIRMCSNSFKIDRGRNVSRSFDGSSLMCVTCLAGEHNALKGRDDLPLVFAISDQHFSPSLPAKDGKECMRILRVEDGSLREIVGEFVGTVGKKALLPGSLILLGSLTQLERDGTGRYAEEWHRCRKWLKEDMGDIMVLPLIPMPMENVTDAATVRSLIEFLSWFEGLPDNEVKLLSDTRKHFFSLYLGRGGVGPGWCDSRQSFALPSSLAGNGRTTFNSRSWGDRPRAMEAFTVERERYWVEKLVTEINRDFSLDLSVDLCISRSAAVLQKAEAGLNKLSLVIAGGSNASRLAAAMAGPEVELQNLAVAGWRMSSDRVAELVCKLDDRDENTVVVFDGLGNVCFLSVDDDMRSGPPYRGRDGTFHAHGKLEVVSGYLLDRLLGCLKDLMLGCKGKKTIIVLPMPRYWVPCCDRQPKVSEEEGEADRKRLLKDLGRLKRTVVSLAQKLKLGNSVHVLDPLETLGLAEDTGSIEQVMVDSVHLVTGSYRVLGHEIRRIGEEGRAPKRTGERRPEPDSKRPRRDSGPWRGPSGSGRGYGGRRGRWSW